MIQNSLAYTYSSVANVHSDKWRAEEARVMLSLLQEEYENSKRLSMPRRYKELQRIIAMFTSEPVLVKMKWLSEQMDNEMVDLCGEDIDNTMDGTDVHADEKDFNGNDKLPMPTFVNDIKSKISKMMYSFSTPIPELYSSPPSSPCTTETSDFSPMFSLYDDRTSQALPNDKADSKSAPNSPVNTTKTPKLPVCHSWPLLKKMISDSFVVPFSKHGGNSISSHQSDNMNETDNKRAAFRRNEAGMYIIKKDEIPDFQIPSLKKSSSQNQTTDMIVPSLYLTSISHPNSRSSKSKFSFKTSSSSSHIHRSDGSSASFSNIDVQKSPTKGFVNKFRFAKCSFQISGDDYDTCEQEVDIQEAYVFLTKLKEDSKELSNCNVLSRYLKMKTMLKKGSKLLRE